MSEESFKRGKAIANLSLGRTAAVWIDELTKISLMHGRSIYEYCYGAVWAEPLLPLKIKEHILIALCAVQGKYKTVERQVRGALNHGATQKEIIEGITTFAHIGYNAYTAEAVIAAQLCDKIYLESNWTGPGRVREAIKKLGSERGGGTSLETFHENWQKCATWASTIPNWRIASGVPSGVPGLPEPELAG